MVLFQARPGISHSGSVSSLTCQPVRRMLIVSGTGLKLPWTMRDIEISLNAAPFVSHSYVLP